ncbi:EcsC family protein [Litoreibacter ponti]|uniref:EcsC family protein n=1 Tax=Litoreibacter ponti TaxID=1510457 RepID=A0A2T6BLL9_9RHOB|nr:EcsC family protein [Litoreibacter ponti]PTX56956.1 EcsC family protein [Litoreibacter ponti]
MSETILPPPIKADPPVEAQIAALARRYRGARGLGLRLMGTLGAQAETLLDRLPHSARSGLDAATMRALELSFSAAHASRGTVPDTGQWLTRALTAGTGAAGGFGGLPSALAELPLTTTVMLRAIQGIAAEHGFDPSHDDTRAECLQVFASAGPLEEDDGTDLSFLTLRMTVSGTTMQALLKQVAPKLALVLGQKLAAQTVPVLGAVTGAAINYTFTSYYQEMAHVSFGLRKLAEETGTDRAQLIAEFRTQVSKRA